MLSVFLFSRAAYRLALFPLNVQLRADLALFSKVRAHARSEESDGLDSLVTYVKLSDLWLLQRLEE